MEFQDIHQIENGCWESNRTDTLLYFHIEEFLPGLFLAESAGHFWHFIDSKTGLPQVPAMVKKPIFIDKEKSAFKVYPYLG